MSLNDSKHHTQWERVGEGTTSVASRASSSESSGGFHESDLLPSFTFDLPRSEKEFSSAIDAFLYYAALAIKQLEAVVKPGAEFHFTPILVAENMPPEGLTEIPSMMQNYKVKSQIINGRLFILDISCGPIHGAGVADLLGQMGVWKSRHSKSQLFSSTTDSMYANGASSSVTPDVVLKASTAYGDEERQGKIGTCIFICTSQCLSSQVF